MKQDAVTCGSRRRETAMALRSKNFGLIDDGIAAAARAATYDISEQPPHAGTEIRERVGDESAHDKEGE